VEDNWRLTGDVLDIKANINDFTPYFQSHTSKEKLAA